MPLIRREPANGAASVALFDEYMALVRDRLGDAFVPSEEIFASADAFAAPGAAWLVVYDEGRAVACGGLRPLAPGTAEIKRMFVTAGARGRGHARTLLAELERIAAAFGYGRVRLYTTAVLAEARALYVDVGYVTVDAPLVRPEDEWLEKDLRASGTL